MTLYFDTKVQFLDGSAVCTECAWHKQQPLFAVASYNQDRGASVTIFDDSGEPLRDITYPVHSTSQATALNWHPERRQLVCGWENGALNMWQVGQREFISIGGIHKSPIVYVGFSEQGGRMVSADSMGIVNGWRCDSHNGQFSSMFTHELRDAVMHATFRLTVSSLVTNELNSLARAAVAGDELALDTLTNWRPRTAARGLTHGGVKDNHCFYAGCQSGVVHYFNQAGTCIEVLRSESSPITQMLWHPKREVIVALMEDMSVGHYMVESSGTLIELERVKLSGRVPGQNGFISWAGDSLAVITGDFTVRIWDIDSSDNFVLPMSRTNATNVTNSIEHTPTPLPMTANWTGMTRTNDDKEESTTFGTAKRMEVFACIAFCTANQTLCAGTNQGRLFTWKKITSSEMTNGQVQPNYTFEYAENAWQLYNISSIRGAVKHCVWGVCDVNKPCVLLNCISNAYILKEQPLLAAHSRNIWLTQKSATQLIVEHSNNRSTVLLGDISAITSVCLNEQYLVITNNRTVVVYKIAHSDENAANKVMALSITQTHSFTEPDCVQLFIWNEVLMILCRENIKFYSVGGVMLREITFNDTEGSPIGASMTGQYLTAFTLNGYIKVYDVSRHEPKLLTPLKSGYDLFGNFGEIIMAKCNATATHVAITIATESLVPDGKLYVWDVERDIVGEYDFLFKTKIPSEQKSEHFVTLPAPLVSRLPTNFCWDTDDARFLACQTCRAPQIADKHVPPPPPPTTSIKLAANATEAKHPNHTLASGQESTTSRSQVVILFIKSGSNVEIKQMEHITLIVSEELVNLCAPYLITQKLGRIERHALSNFKGIETCNATTQKLILDFSLFIADGKMDEAFRCIRSIQSNVVWENLVRMCVHTGRLDVAQVCLGHLKRAISVRALRIAMDDDTLEPEAKIAVLAIELNMIAEAEALYKKCGRYDLLNELLQACGRFDEALQIAERLDRVHLKNTFYQYAEWQKEQGDINHAVIYYDKSNNATHNITQMLINEPVLLKQYMMDTTDPNMLKWWAQYTESLGDMDGALKIYQKAEDWFSQVRILCFLGELSRADAIASNCGDKSASYHLARHYENIGKIPEAVKFYTRAQTYSNAVRICKEHDLSNELWMVANAARAKEKAIAAAYFEEIGDYKRAVELYHRAGNLHKAVEMAFASEQPETLQVIAADLDAQSDPELTERCAEFFVESQQPQKAAHLFATAKQYERSLDICRSFKVHITETLADLLTPIKDEVDDTLRIKILTTLGDLLQQQGDYHAATKKFTQASDKVRAMATLIKSGDTDKIVFFAGMSRQKEVYVMAANYLQSLNWQSDGKVLKNIIQFYTKGHAYDLLANFYANCAQVEIDEFHDYEKAYKALQEAMHCVVRITSSQKQRITDNLQNACVEVKKVLEVQDALERGDYNNVIAVCRSMLSINERPPVRFIHIQAILVEAMIRAKQYSDALNVLRQLSTKSSDWSYRGLLEKPLIEKLAHECGIEFNMLWNLGRRTTSTDEQTDANAGDDDDGDEIQEEIE